MPTIGHGRPIAPFSFFNPPQPPAGPAPFRQIAWENPMPRSKQSVLLEVGLSFLLVLHPNQLGFTNKDQPNPQVRSKYVQVDPVPNNLILGIPILTPRTTVVSNSYKSKYLQVDPVPNYLPLGLPPPTVALPFSLEDQPNPYKARYRDVDPVPNYLPATANQLGFTNEDQPNPYKARYLQVDSVPNLTIRNPAQLGFTNQDQPNPYKSKYLQVDPIPRFLPATPNQLGFTTLDQPNPPPKIKYRDIDPVFNYLPIGLPLLQLPFSLTDWPNPRRAYDINSHGVWMLSSSVFGSPLVWGNINTGQLPSWVPVADAQTPNWTPVVDIETPNWTAVTTPSGAWTPVSDAQSPGWVVVTPPIPPSTKGGVT